MQRHVSHLAGVLVADPERQTTRDDVTVADRLNFIDAKLSDALVERTQHKHSPWTSQTTRQNWRIYVSTLTVSDKLHAAE